MTAARRQLRTANQWFGHHQSISVLFGMAVVSVILPIVAQLPPFSSFQPLTTWLNTFTLAGVYVLLALGLNIVVGLSGLLDLGYAAFFAIGSYAYAFGASNFYGNHVPFWIMLVIGLGVAAVFGLLLGAPTLRLRGDYLAIVTLGFGEIVPIVFKNGGDLTGGVNGISNVDPPTFFGYSFSTIELIPFYIVMVGLVTFALIFIYRLQESRLGRAWQAIREDELAAASNGINTVSTKLLAFALGASTAGLAGAFAASKLTFVGPDQFNFTVSFTILAMVVLGGMGNQWGVALGAFVLFLINTVFLNLLNQFFDAVNVPILKDVDFIQYKFLLYGIALVLMMLLRPQGFFPSRRRAQELHAGGDGALDSPSGDDAEGELSST